MMTKKIIQEIAIEINENKSNKKLIKAQKTGKIVRMN